MGGLAGAARRVGAKKSFLRAQAGCRPVNHHSQPSGEQSGLGETDKNGQPMKTLVSVSVSVRNTDPLKPIRITSAQYYDTDGKKLREYVTSPKTVVQMGTYELFIPRSDDTGGSGANFVAVGKAREPPHCGRAAREPAGRPDHCVHQFGAAPARRVSAVCPPRSVDGEQE